MRCLGPVSVATVVFALAGCGGSAKAYSVDQTRNCLSSRGVRVAGDIGNDRVARSATGGAIAARLGDNSVKLVFGETEDDAENIELGYERFAFDNVREGLRDVLRRDRNAVMLWEEHPQDSDLALVEGCLK